MSAYTTLRYSPIVVGAGATVPITSNMVGKFICTTTGTITIVANAADGKPQTTLLTTFAVTGGQIYELNLYLGKEGGTITSASAVGVLGV